MAADPLVLDATAFIQRETGQAMGAQTPAQLQRVMRVLAGLEASNRLAAEAAARKADEAAGLLRRLQTGGA